MLANQYQALLMISTVAQGSPRIAIKFAYIYAQACNSFLNFLLNNLQSDKYQYYPDCSKQAITVSL